MFSKCLLPTIRWSEFCLGISQDLIPKNHTLAEERQRDYEEVPDGYSGAYSIALTKDGEIQITDRSKRKRLSCIS